MPKVALRLYDKTIDPGDCIVKSQCRMAVGGRGVEPVEPFTRRMGGREFLIPHS
jgi:hypothetical protein